MLNTSFFIIYYILEYCAVDSVVLQAYFLQKIEKNRENSLNRLNSGCSS